MKNAAAYNKVLQGNPKSVYSALAVADQKTIKDAVALAKKFQVKLASYKVRVIFGPELIAAR